MEMDVLFRISLRMLKTASNRSLTQFDLSGKDVSYLTKYSLLGREGSRPTGVWLGLRDPGSFPDFSFVRRLVPLMVARRLPVVIRASAPRLGTLQL